MKKKLLCLFMLGGIIGTSAIAQNLNLKSETVSGVQDRVAVKRTTTPNTAGKLVLCSEDEVDYTWAKNLKTGSVQGFNMLANSQSAISGISQWFPAPQSITVKGFYYLARTTSGTATLSASISTAAADSTPTTALASATTGTINTSLSWRSVLFTAPVTVTQAYTLTLENLSTTVGVSAFSSYFTTNLDTASGRGEKLARAKYGAAWYDPSLLYTSFDADFIIVPIVEYSVTASFTGSSTTGCASTGIELTNTSSPILSSRFYNVNKFANHFFAEPDETFTWTLPQGTSHSYNTTATSSSAGEFEIELEAFFDTWVATCGDIASDSLTFTAPESADFTYSSANFCKGSSDPTPTITGVPAGIFTSTSGLVFTDTLTGQINLAASPAGTYTVTYTTNGSCPGIATQEVTISNLPTVTLAEPTVTLCADAGLYTLAGGSPAGGTYTIDGTPASSFQPSSSNVGTHTLVYTYSDPVTGCTDSTSGSIEVEICTGIASNSALASTKVFPNPTRGTLTIEATSNVSVQILNTLGAVVASVPANTRTVKVDLSNQPNGIYFVRISSEEGSVTKKVNLIK